MLTVVAAAALAAAFALLILVRREPALRDDQPVLALAFGRRFAAVPSGSRRPVRGPLALATVPLPDPEPPRQPPEGAGPVEPAPDLDAVRLEEWRREQLVELGVEPDEADAAAREDVDAAAVRELVERGCPPALALRIVR